MSGMGLAHYSAKDASAVPNDGDAVAPFLTTGYIDNGGSYHDLGYVESTGAANLSGFSTTITKLTTTVSFQIDVDWTNGEWYQSNKSTAATGRANAAYLKKGSNFFAADDVLDGIKGKTVKVGVKSTAADASTVGARIIQAGGAPSTAAAQSGDPLMNSGCTVVNTSYAQVNAAQALTGIDSAAVDVTGTAVIYVFGGSSSTSHDSAVDAELGLWISANN